MAANLIETAEPRVRIHFRQLDRPALRLLDAPEAVQHHDQIGHRRDIVRLAIEDMREHLLRLLQVTVALVDRAERVVRSQKRRRLHDGFARPPVGVIDTLAAQRFDSTAVHVLRRRHLLADNATAAQVIRRKKSTIVPSLAA